jgi:hypothetical protein
VFVLWRFATEKTQEDFVKFAIEFGPKREPGAEVICFALKPE